MVERLQDNETESLTGATFVDLDGTLIAGNSMHIFMKRLPGMLQRSHAHGAAISSLWRIFLRSLRLSSHKSLKWHLTKIARRHLDDDDWDILAEELSGMVNTDVVDYIESRRARGCLTFIATAALEEYTLPLCRMLGYDGVLATRFTESKRDYSELNRHDKRQAIENLLSERNLRLESFLTDHTDDMPTAKAYPNLTILVGASGKTAEAFRDVGVMRHIN